MAPSPRLAGVPRQTKTARFLTLVTERHGPLATVPLHAVAGIAAALAPTGSPSSAKKPHRQIRTAGSLGLAKSISACMSSSPAGTAPAAIADVPNGLRDLALRGRLVEVP
jgi:di/tricarboxylate transporter